MRVVCLIPSPDRPYPVYRLFTPYFLFFCCPFFLYAQNNTRSQQQAQYKLSIARTGEKIAIDGDLSESVWQSTAPATAFMMKWPRDGGPAPQQTEVRCTYNDQFLYVAFHCVDSTPNHVVASLKRDVGYWDSDAVSIILDPMNVANNGFFFGISSAGVQTEGLLSGSGDGDMDTNWDNTWFSETKQLVNGWTAECAIPLRILRYKSGQNRWGINFIRNDLGKNMYSIWAAVPFQFEGVDLGWTGALEWDAPPPRAKGNYNISPYLTAGGTRDYEEGEKWKTPIDAGVDAKIGIGSGLNLDLTLNPDFSQIEIDEQVINLTRFDVMLPEKRTFFLENADLFGNFGIPPIRPFFSRRVGLDDAGIPLPILGGLRLTGNIDDNTRVGLMNMQTRAKEGKPARNFTALAANRRLFGRTTLSGYFLNREEFDGRELRADGYSRNAGMEFSYTSTDGKWAGWATHHRSMKPGISDKNWWGNSGAQYSTRKFSILLDFTHTGENYYADMGFEQRVENYDYLRDTTLRIGYNFVFSNMNYRIFPKKEQGKINFIEFEGEFFQVINPDGSYNESSNRLQMSVNFKNTSQFNVGINPSWTNVPVSFKFDDGDGAVCPPLPAAVYRFASAGAEWSSDYRKPLIFYASANIGSFYSGRQTGLEGRLTWRLQPVMNLTLGASYNRLNFPAPYCDVALFNITPRVEVFFARNLWWTTFVQYNTQADNFNINSRLQWRYRPMSDLFIVYTDNYNAVDWNVKSRALVLKTNYWF